MGNAAGKSKYTKEQLAAMNVSRTCPCATLFGWPHLLAGTPPAARAVAQRRNQSPPPWIIIQRRQMALLPAQLLLPQAPEIQVSPWLQYVNM